MDATFDNDAQETFTLERFVDYLKLRREQKYTLDEIIELLESQQPGKL